MMWAKLYIVLHNYCKFTTDIVAFPTKPDFPQACECCAKEGDSKNTLDLYFLWLIPFYVNVVTGI